MWIIFYGNKENKNPCYFDFFGSIFHVRDTGCWVGLLEELQLRNHGLQPGSDVIQIRGELLRLLRTGLLPGLSPDKLPALDHTCWAERPLQSRVSNPKLLLHQFLPDCWSEGASPVSPNSSSCSSSSRISDTLFRFWMLPLHWEVRRSWRWSKSTMRTEIRSCW